MIYILIINIRDANMVAAISLIIKKQTCIIRAYVILLIINKYFEIVVKLRLSRLINAVPRKSRRSFKTIEISVNVISFPYSF